MTFPILTPSEGVEDSTSAAALHGAAPDEPRGAERFLADVADSDWNHEELNYLAVNTLYARGSTPKAVRHDAVKAIRTLQAILADARAITAAARGGGSTSAPHSSALPMEDH